MEPRLRVAYVLSRAPQPKSTFTNDEVAALADLVDVTPVGLLCDADDEAWLTAAGAASPRLWLSVLRHAIRQPIALGRGLGMLASTGMRRPPDAAAGLRAGLAACDLVNSLDVDVVHAQFAGPAAAGAYVLHYLTGLPYTVRAHAYDIYRPYSWAGRVLTGSAAVASISEHGAEQIMRRWGLRSRVIRVGVPLDSVARRDDRRPGDPMRFVSVGALTPKKGHDLLIAAMHRVNRASRRVTLDIYGEGPLRSELQARSDPATVRFRGSLDSESLRRRYSAYDAFALASRVAADGDMDGIPVVLMEASLAGLPIVTTNVAGIPELIVDGLTGLSRPPTSESLADAIESVLGNYAEARSRASAARERVRQRHDLRRSSLELVEVWRDILSSSGKARSARVDGTDTYRPPLLPSRCRDASRS